MVKEEDKDNSTLLVAMEEIIRMSTPPAKGSRLSRTGKLKKRCGDPGNPEKANCPAEFM